QLIYGGAGTEAREMALRIATSADLSSVVRALLTCGAPPEAWDQVLDEALHEGRAEVLNFLLSQVNDLTSLSPTVAQQGLIIAARTGYLPLLETVLKAKPPSEQLQRALLAAAEAGKETVLLKLLDARADVHFDLEGALRAAAREGQVSTVKFLLDRG